MALGRFALIVVVAALALAPEASAATFKSTKTIRGQLVFRTGQNPKNPGNCVAAVMIQWPAEKGWLAQSVHYVGPPGNPPSPQGQAVSPPYDDTFTFVAKFTVAPGHHWVMIGESHRSGSKPSTCADLQAKQRPVISKPTVDLVRTTACVKANTKLVSAGKAVTALEKRLKHASRRTKPHVRKQLAAAKHKQAKALSADKKVC